jgi:hypothetical protein
MQQHYEEGWSKRRDVKKSCTPILASRPTLLCDRTLWKPFGGSRRCQTARNLAFMC